MADDDGETIFFPAAASGDTVFGAKLRMEFIYSDAVRRIGKRQARAILKELYTGATSKRRERQWETWSYLARLDAMPEPVPFALAKEIAGPKATPEEINAINARIGRAIKSRARAQKAGTWHGPGSRITSGVMIISSR
jgi:hypothetical protein